MNNSRKDLIAQRNEIEQELYAQQEQVQECKQDLVQHKSFLIGGLALLAPLVIMLLATKNKNKLVQSALAAGKLASVAYVKKLFLK